MNEAKNTLNANMNEEPAEIRLLMSKIQKTLEEVVHLREENVRLKLTVSSLKVEVDVWKEEAVLRGASPRPSASIEGSGA